MKACTDTDFRISKTEAALVCLVQECNGGAKYANRIAPAHVLENSHAHHNVTLQY